MSVDRSIRPRSTPAATLRSNPFLGPGDEHMVVPPTAAEVAAITGRAPTDGFSFDALASPQAALFGGESLAEVNTPIWGLPTPYAGQRAVGFGMNSNAHVDAANNTVFDFSTGSFAWLLLLHFGDAPGGTRDVFGKHQGGGPRYSSVVNNSGLLTFQAKDTTVYSAQAGSVSVAGLKSWCWFSIDRTADTLWCTHRRAVGSKNIAALGSLANTGTFKLGHWNATTTEFDCLAGYLFDGAAGEGDGTGVIEDLANYMDE